MANKKPLKLESGSIQQFAATDTIAPANGGTGLAAVGAANSVLGTNAAADALEHKTLTAAGNVVLTHTAGDVEIASDGSTSNIVAVDKTIEVDTSYIVASYLDVSAALTVNGNLLVLGAADPIAVAISDEGTLKTSTIESINFTGAGVTVTNTGAAVTVDIPGGGGGTFPKFSAYNSTSHALTVSASTKILFQTENFDTNNNFASSRFTPTVAGYYNIIASLETTGTTECFLYLYKNGSLHKTLSGMNISMGSGSALVYMNGSTDYLEVFGYLDSAASTVNQADTTFFEGYLVP